MTGPDVGEDFAGAAARHWADAELLLKQGRRENADQLYGISAECAIKTALISPPSHQKAGELPATFRYHVDELWERVSINSIPRHLAGLAALLKHNTPFADWSIEQRYWGVGNLTDDAIERHRSGAKRLLTAVHVVGHRGN